MVKFIPVKENEISIFITKLQQSFAKAVIEHFGSLEDGPIPPDEDIIKSVKEKNAETYYIHVADEEVGGIILNINKETHHNHVDFLFIMPKCHGKGVGTQIWKAIEEKYPETEIWELNTPYFEERNIHFYINKCGFHIVEFYNKYHPDPHASVVNKEGTEFSFFRFEKRMK